MNYKHIIFDLDHTLWDYETAARQTLGAIFLELELSQITTNLNVESFLKLFFEINKELWQAYNLGIITSDELRETRFKKIFQQVNIEISDELNQKIYQTYSQSGPKQPYLMDGALEVLEYLQNHYMLHILTNGFYENQIIKLESSNIKHFFEHIITPEKSGYKKPHPQAFHFTLEQIGTDEKSCLMIGDNLDTDIKGAKEIGLDHVFFNDKKMKHQSEVQREINHLIELKEFL